MGEAIHTGDAKIPPPSYALFWSIAEACYEQARQHTTGQQLAAWSQLSDVARDRWFQIARAAYAEVAKAGGARVRSLGR